MAVLKGGRGEKVRAISHPLALLEVYLGENPVLPVLHNSPLFPH